MKNKQVKSNFNRGLIATLSVASLTGVLAPQMELIAAAEGAHSEVGKLHYEETLVQNPDFIVTLENIRDLWHMFFDTNYGEVFFEFTDEASKAFGDIWMEKLQAEIAQLPEEYFIQVEQERDALALEEEYFWTNLSPEFLWEQYVIEHPSALRKRGAALDAVKEDIQEAYELITYKRQYQNIQALASSIFGNPSVERMTRWLATEAGMPLITRNTIEAVGAVAWADAVRTRIEQRWAAGGNREDAYRHWVWNGRLVRNNTVGVRNARIFTTYREIASFIWRHAYVLNGIPMNIGLAGPTATQIIWIRRMRRDFINMNETLWLSTSEGGFNTAGGRSEQMDLWNNHWGRVDGQNGAPTLASFNTRWNNTAVNNGLSRGNGLHVSSEMTVARQRRLRSQGFHRPL